jgi:hypothetical protein
MSVKSDMEERKKDWRYRSPTTPTAAAARMQGANRCKWMGPRKDQASGQAGKYNAIGQKKSLTGPWTNRRQIRVTFR